MELDSLGSDVLNEIERWIDDPSRACMALVLRQPAVKDIKFYNEFFKYRIRFIKMFFKLIQDRLCDCSASVGNLELLMWARSRYCNWDEDVCTVAAANGHYEVLK